MAKLDDRVALITGAGRGIGRAIALRLANAGACVVLTARGVEELHQVKREVQEAGGSAATVVCDLSKREQSVELIRKATECFGPIDILVNNAGVGSSSDPKPLADYDDSFWDLSLEVNLTAPYILSKAVLPHMRQQRWGRIITIASVNSRITAVHAGAYTASKHGVLGLTRALAMEYASEGITVNCVCPGPVKTIMNNVRVEYDAARLGRTVEEHEHQLTPIGGRLEPDDISPMVEYLASDEARMITGQGYNIDGGRCMA